MHPQAAQLRHNRTKAIVALLLTFAAGFVDVVGFLRIYDAFAANMTGNTVHLAQHLLAPSRQHVLVSAAVLLSFLAGSVFGRLVIEIGARKRFRHVATITLLMEAALIAAVALMAGPNLQLDTRLSLAVMLAGAMGLQTASLTRLGPLTVHTTFVTGMINKLAQLLSHALFLTWDLSRGRAHLRRQRQTTLRQTAFIFSIWLLYFAGAVAGVGMLQWFNLNSLFVPVGLLVVAVVVDQFHPLSLQEERDELEQAA